tara:strand:+ start:384 stop:572 length:189 start_codon:yes stop_codon:yes gene_type:complete
MSWYGNLEGVGELSEEDKTFIEAQHKASMGDNFIKVGLFALAAYLLSSQANITRSLNKIMGK